MQREPNFWQHKNLLEMNDAEWEALCDGCGKCCYRKYIDELEEDCTKLTKDNLPEFGWLPTTCAYRLLYEGKPLPSWHPLISGDPESVKRAGVLIQNGIHECDVIDWFEFVVDEDDM